jgi:hypothetical protein
MKKITKISILALLLTPALLFNSCEKAEDLVTKDAKSGGLIYPTENIPYKLGVTPELKVAIRVPQGPAINTINVYSTYTRNADTATSTTVLLGSLSVDGKNATADYYDTLNVTYTNLINGLTIEGAALPTDEGQLVIGDGWTFVYKSELADGRTIESAITTGITVANAYAGTYSVAGIFHHPTAGDRAINEEKYLEAVSAYSVKTGLGDLGASGYEILITVNPSDNSVSVTAGNSSTPDVLPSSNLDATLLSYYEPATGKFYLYYYYVGASGNRVVEEVYTPE